MEEQSQAEMEPWQATLEQYQAILSQRRMLPLSQEETNAVNNHLLELWKKVHEEYGIDLFRFF
jgi:hypothetical protein